ncbi:MAG: tol-pal system protein YbgF [Myxococcota bacterium]|nr:tol-pal system protein YbgF [Myxococcota bacterium]
MRSGHTRAWILVSALLPPLLAGCATVAEHRKLERRIYELEQGGAASPASPDRERLAEIAARLDGMEAELQRLAGRVEVAEHQAAKAMEQARAARSAAAASTPAPAAQEPPDDVPDGASAEEVRAYREAWTAWSEGQAEVCIDRFRDFLQTYSSSNYAENASYWMADCYFKRGDYKTAILRFDDVVARYPEGKRAPDALYRQGEALLRAGYGQAAGKAFERVIDEYPDSTRAREARRQLELLGSG